MFDPPTMEAALADGFLKTAEDWEAAGRIAARGYEDEMTKLCAAFGVEPPPREAANRVDVSSIMKELGLTA